MGFLLIEGDIQGHHLRQAVCREIYLLSLCVSVRIDLGDCLNIKEVRQEVRVVFVVHLPNDFVEMGRGLLVESNCSFELLFDPDFLCK